MKLCDGGGLDLIGIDLSGTCLYLHPKEMGSNLSSSSIYWRLMNSISGLIEETDLTKLESK